ncbi:MAG: 8-amino-7-oxononanoate synthase, partial [Terrimicrobiaceae bacterium]
SMVAPAQGPMVESEGKTLHNFSSNDYLGLANHPEVRQSAQEAISRAGAGSGASRLICGTLPEHLQLEADVATFKRCEAALTFSSGYAAALGAIPALVGKGDVIILDKLCHACLVDGAQMSGATLRVFPHNDLAALESRLLWARKTYPEGKILILAESVYSMDGDLAPLADIVELKDHYRAWLLLDEAHGVGVLGEGGRGLADALGVAHRIELQMGTLGKALGSAGAYVCGAGSLREFLINRARSFVFSTSPPPSAAAAASAAIRLLSNPQTAGSLISALHGNVRRLCGNLQLPLSPSPIIPIILGAEDKALQISALLLEAGFLVPAIRFPTVARGQARLRITLTSGHTTTAIDHLTSAIQTTKDEGGT